MERRIKKSDFLLVTLLVFMILEYHFFYLVPISSYYARALLGRFSRIGIGLLSLIIYGAYFRTPVSKSVRFVCYYSLIVFIVLTIYSYFMKIDQGLFQVFGATSQYLCILLAKPLYILFRKYDKYEIFIKWLNIAICFWFLVMLYQNSIGITKGEMILKQYYQTDNIDIGEGRFDNARISVFSLGAFISIYNFYKLVDFYYKKKPLFFHIFGFVLGSYCIVFISQGRAQSLAYLFALFILFMLYPSKSYRSFVKPLFLLLVGATFFATNVATDFLATFSSKSDLYLSSYYRGYEYSYFMKQFLMNPILGHGLYYSAYPEMYSSNYGVMWSNDVGFIGMLGTTGIFGCGLFVYIMYRIIYNTRIQYRLKLSISNFVTGLLGYLVLGSASILFTGAVSIMILPVAFAISESYIGVNKDGPIRYY